MMGELQQLFHWLQIGLKLSQQEAGLCGAMQDVRHLIREKMVTSATDHDDLILCIRPLHCD